MNPAGDKLPLAQQTGGGPCEHKQDGWFMGDKKQWQEKDQHMKKKKKETELINANMKNNKAQITGTTLHLQNKS